MNNTNKIDSPQRILKLIQLFLQWSTLMQRSFISQYLKITEANQADLSNKENGKCYIGSSIDLGTRFRQYYSLNYMKKEVDKSNILIYKALLKYGHSNFSLEILEYCEFSKTIALEQVYISNSKPEYNILLTAGSSLGRLHTQETALKSCFPPCFA
jgi:hypothetical protein